MLVENRAGKQTGIHAELSTNGHLSLIQENPASPESRYPAWPKLYLPYKEEGRKKYTIDYIRGGGALLAYYLMRGGYLWEGKLVTRAEIIEDLYANRKDPIKAFQSDAKRLREMGAQFDIDIKSVTLPRNGPPIRGQHRLGANYYLYIPRNYYNFYEVVADPEPHLATLDIRAFAPGPKPISFKNERNPSKAEDVRIPRRTQNVPWHSRNKPAIGGAFFSSLVVHRGDEWEELGYSDYVHRGEPEIKLISMQVNNSSSPDNIPNPFSIYVGHVEKTLEVIEEDGIQATQAIGLITNFLPDISFKEAEILVNFLNARSAYLTKEQYIAAAAVCFTYVLEGNGAKPREIAARTQVALVEAGYPQIARAIQLPVSERR